METDWRKLVESPDIDLVDIASPNDTHAEIAIAAAHAGKMVMCEKPLGRNAAESRSHGQGGGGGRRSQHGLVQLPPRSRRHAGQATGSTKAAWASVFHYRAKFLQDWTISSDLPQGGDGLWRLGRECRGQRRDRRPAGPLHRYRHVAQRRHRRSHRHDRDVHQEPQAHAHRAKWSPWASTTPAPFWRASRNGSLATFEATRYARGHKALYTLEINGEHASIIWDLHDLHRLQFFDHRDEGRLRGWRSIHITDSDHPYMKHWWVPGLADRLRAHVHPPGRRFPLGHGRRAAMRSPPSAKGCAPTMSPMPCWHRPPTVIGSRFATTGGSKCDERMQYSSGLALAAARPPRGRPSRRSAAAGAAPVPPARRNRLPAHLRRQIHAGWDGDPEFLARRKRRPRRPDPDRQAARAKHLPRSGAAAARPISS